MTPEHFETILSKIEGHGDHIYLHVKGEPLYHPHFEDILRLCEKYNKQVNITTNGTLLPVHAETILKCKAVRLVNISLQSFEEANAQKYMAYLIMVLNFVKAGLASTKILFDLRLWNFGGADLVPSQETAKIIELIEGHLDLGHPIYITDTNTKGGKLTSNVYISKGYAFEWPSQDNDFLGTVGTCFGLRHQIAILSSGVVVPCCLDAEGAIPLGNLLDLNANFEDIVTSQRAQAIVKGFEGDRLVESLCMHCSYRKRYFNKKNKGNGLIQRKK